jgi:hypothetical protein
MDFFRVKRRQTKFGRHDNVFTGGLLMMIRIGKYRDSRPTDIGLKEEYLKQKLRENFDGCQSVEQENPPKWLDNMEFEVLDVREGHNTYIAEISIKAKSLPANKGLEIIHSEDPKPLISVMAGMGWTHFCKIIGVEEYHIYFTQDERVLNQSCPDSFNKIT